MARHRQTLFGILLQFCWMARTSQSSDMLPTTLLEGPLVGLGSQWREGTEQWWVVGRRRETEGGRKEIKERRKGRMGV